jgi:integrase
MPLTVKGIAKLTARGRYLDERGLYLQVLSPTNQSWVYRYERAGKEHWLGLGPVHAFRLEEARDRARKARQLLADGIDPLEAKRAERAARVLATAKIMTFKEATQQYHAGHEKQWSNPKHRAQFLSTLVDYAYPHIGHLPVSTIDTGMVLKVLEPIWLIKTETAVRVRGRMEKVLDWATVRGNRVGDNPARWRGHLDQVLPKPTKVTKPKHHQALPYGEMNDFMGRLAKRPGIAARALEFTISTAARTGEVIGAKWDEIDLTAKVWTVPASRMKGDRDNSHRIPLNDKAMAALRSLPREAEFVFPGGSKGAPISNMAMATVLRRMGRDDVTVHGFRSAFRDWAGDEHNCPNHIVEMALAHVIGDKVEAAYRRSDLFDKRRRLMADWAAYCDRPPVSQGARSNVHKLRAGQ